MANGNKPKEILELEKRFGVELEEFLDNIKTENQELIQFYYHFHAYIYNDSAGKITGLKLYSLKISNLDFLDDFKDLLILNLSNNQLKSIEAIKNLPQLIHLDINENLIEDISPIADLKFLNVLSIGSNPIKDLSCISKFQKLTWLSVNNLGIKNLDFIAGLSELSFLSAINNFIEDISTLSNFRNLQYFFFKSNLIRQIPFDIVKKYYWLSSPYKHSFENGNVETVPVELLIGNNPLEFPPISVIDLGPETVQNYYEAAEQFGHVPLSEGRVIVIGDGSAGKSSLIERMLYGTFEKGRAQTNGIKIEHWHLPNPDDDRELTFHIWDFGGQEIQHAVHKFFFSEGCVYVLVLDNRREEEPEYWLQQIESLGGKSPVLVVFNKRDENPTEIADRKYLKAKYPNIIGFFNTSCLNGFGIDDFRKTLEQEAVKLRTVRERFPNNWLAIKKSIEENTTGNQHYLTYETYRAICDRQDTPSEPTQRLLLRYFNTIGAVTWFGEDTHLKFLHVLKPEWITQGVYKILTATKTARLFGQIEVGDFKELLYPLQESDYTYEERHYGYILSMMKKFELCDTPDNKHLLIPSAFGKEPKVEYSDFRGEEVRTYILRFKEYMPLALIHRFTAKNLRQVLDHNYWYTGIVIKDHTGTLAMVHADKKAKCIYVRIKGNDKLGMWGHIRRQMADIASSYAKIPYDELVALDDSMENKVKYEDLISHLQAKKPTYFHAGLKKDFNVGYLIGLFENQDSTLEKIKTGQLVLNERDAQQPKDVPTFILNLLNNNNPVINTNISNQLNIDIDINIVNNLSGDVQGEANYFLEELGKENLALKEALEKLVQFAEDAKQAKTSSDVKAKGWGRKLKNVLETVVAGAKQLKDLKDGGAALKAMLNGVKELANHVHLQDIADFITNLPFN